MDIACYSQRLLNPFRGVVNIIKYESAEAVTTDGLNWDIYVSNEALLRDLPPGKRIQISDIRYGHWSAESGLKRGPIYPSADFRRLETMGAVVYEHLLKVCEQVPFPFEDRYELWLLDTDLQPLALLHSDVDDRRLDFDVPLDWRAGHRCHDSFNSPVMQQIAGEDNAADYLVRYMRGCSGDCAAVQWFVRAPDGSGTALSANNVPPGQRQRTLSGAAFPHYYVQRPLHDALHRQLIDDFIAWQSPWMLLRPDLSQAVRQQMEQLAGRQALVVGEQQRLYPDIIDQDAINSARVEAMMRRSQPAAEARDESVFSTWYLELGRDSGA